MARRFGIGWSCGDGSGGAGCGNAAGLRDDAVQHLQNALQFLALDYAGGAVSACPAQLEAERVLLTGNRQPVGELGTRRCSI